MLTWGVAFPVSPEHQQQAAGDFKLRKWKLISRLRLIDVTRNS